MILFDVDIGESVQRTLDELFAFLPNLVGALLILVLGYLIARVVGRLAQRGLRAAGADRALATGTAGEYRERFAPGLQPSRLVGTIVFWIVFALAIMLAVSALGVEALTSFIEAVVAYLPNVVAAILILLVAVAIAGAVGGIAQRLLGGTMLGKIVQTTVPVLVIAVALFMALVQLKIATEIVVATYVIVLGSVGLGFALAFGLGGRAVADRILSSAYESGRENMPELRRDAAQAETQARRDAERLKDKVEGNNTGPAGATVRPEPA